MKNINQKLLAISGLTTDQLYGILDYALGVLLITLPWFFVTENNMTPLLLIMFSGVVLIVYSMFTDYKYGLIRWLSAKFDTIMDISAGLLFIVAAYPFYNINYLGIAFVITGVFIISGVLLLEITGKKISFFHRHQEWALS